MSFIIINIAAISYLIFFLRENAYKAIVPDRDYIITESKQVTGDIDTDKLQKVLDGFDKKGVIKTERIEYNPFAAK